MEQLANNASSTLTGTVNNSSDPVVLTVASATLFPASGNFRILIDNEILLVTGVSGTSFTCARAQEGTTIASHANGQTVEHILTKGSLLQVFADFSSSGVFSARPAAGIAGRRYQCTDCPFWYLDNGTTWDKFYSSYPIVTPDDTGYSWDDQNASVLTTTKDMLTMFPENNASFRYKAAPSTPYSIVACAIFNGNGDHLLDFHFGFRQSSDGKLHTLSVRMAAGVLSVNSWKWTSSTVFLTQYKGNNLTWTQGGLLFLKIADDGTNRICSISGDGVNFTPFHTVGRTDFLTANQICWGTGSDTGSTGDSVSLIHWR